MNINEYKTLKPGMYIRNIYTSKIHYVLRVYDDYVIIDDDYINMCVRYDIRKDEDLLEDITLVSNSIHKSIILNAYYIMDEEEIKQFQDLVLYLDPYVGEDLYEEGAEDVFIIETVKDFHSLSARDEYDKYSVYKVLDDKGFCYLDIININTNKKYEIPYNNLGAFLICKPYEEAEQRI